VRDCGGVAANRLRRCLRRAGGRAEGGREAGAVYNRDLIVSREMTPALWCSLLGAIFLRPFGRASPKNGVGASLGALLNRPYIYVDGSGLVEIGTCSSTRDYLHGKFI
jgi:hypothetical protein